jgi:dolichol-phosphate mannosyltransferase
MLISIVFSFRNEEDNILELIKRIDAAMLSINDVTYEMIFVNDNSSDHSLTLLQRLQQQYPIVIINMSRRFGVGPCILAGFSYAKGDAVIYMDADLQDPPEIIPQMIERFRDGADVVHTTRSFREGEGAVKLYLTKKAYSIINFFSDLSLPENTGDYKLLSRKVVREILDLPERDPYLRGLSVWVGYRQDYILYRRNPRFSGKSKFPLLSKGPVLEFLRGLTGFSVEPLYISFFLGVLTSLFAVVLILYALSTKFLGIAVPGVSGVLIAVALFSGIILISQGIMGLYVARIYQQVQGRPRYMINDVILPPK